MDEVSEDRCYGPCLQKYCKHQEPSADRKHVCKSTIECIRIYFTDIIADELNVKEVTFTEDVESFTSYSFKPQLRTVGPKYGKLLGGIRTGTC